MLIHAKRFAAFLVAAITLITSFSMLAVPSFADNEGNIVTVADETALKALLESESGANIALSSNIEINLSEYSEYIYSLKADVVLDLCGYSIAVVNSANVGGSCEDSTLFCLLNGASLVINDSSEGKTGSISYFGGIHYYNEAQYLPFMNVTSRNLFFLSSGSSLTVNGGSFTSGNSEKEWLHRAAGITNNAFEFYTGFCENVICGTVFTVDKNATLTLNGGAFTAYGRSRDNHLPNLKLEGDISKSASVCVRALAGACVTINDGSFIGSHGADVFALDSESNSSVRAGTFNTTPVENERISDYDTFAAVNTGAYCGKVNLPVSFVPNNSRSAFIQNGAFLSSLSDAIDGSTLILAPHTASSPSITSSNVSNNYSIGSKGTLNVNYTPYFSCDSVVNYAWYAVSSDGSSTLLTNSNTPTIDLAKISSNGYSLSASRTYSFRCVITESYSSYTLVTVASSFSFKAKNRRILTSVSLTPSSINSDNLYFPSSIPSFSVPTNANYSISDVSFYERNSSTAIPSDSSLKSNTRYYIVLTLSAKGSYIFNYDTKVSVLTGASDISIVPSADGKSATVGAWILTSCTHNETEYLLYKDDHVSVCKHCGKIIFTSKHSFSEYTPCDSIAEDFCEMERSCAICGYTELSGEFLPVEGEKTPIYEINLDFIKPISGDSPSTPFIRQTPDYDKLILKEYSWTDSSGKQVTSFKSENTYVLTAVFTLSDIEKYIFSEETLTSCRNSSNITATLSDDMTELTVIYEVKVGTKRSKSINLPTVNCGESIISANATVDGPSYTISWYKDGNCIGNYTVVGTQKTIHDYDPEDDTDFAQATFNDSSIYYCRINWNTESKEDTVLDENIYFFNSPAIKRDYMAGADGFATAYYIPSVTDTYIRTLKVSGLTEPKAGNSPANSATVSNPACTVKSVAFTCNGRSVSKFECGKAYTVNITISTSEGYTFSNIAASINGNSATVTSSGDDIILSYTFSSLGHDIDHRSAVITLPSCESLGSITQTCKGCDLSLVTELGQVPHSKVIISGKEADCTHAGILSHYICAGCLKLYSDIDLQNEISFEATVIPPSAEAHVEYPMPVHDGNYHYTVCSVCSSKLGEDVEHHYGEKLTDEEGNTYHTCECGHSVGLSGPKIPDFIIGGEDETIIEKNDPILNLGGFSMETVKAILLILVIFAVILIGAIITLSVILIVTSDRFFKKPIPVSSTDPSIDKTEKAEPVANASKK